MVSPPLQQDTPFFEQIVAAIGSHHLAVHDMSEARFRDSEIRSVRSIPEGRPEPMRSICQPSAPHHHAGRPIRDSALAWSRENQTVLREGFDALQHRQRRVSQVDLPTSYAVSRIREVVLAEYVSPSRRSSRSGRSNQNVDPSFSTLSNPKVPPIVSMNSFVSDRPMPVP